jgi:hypothetical protein
VNLHDLRSSLQQRLKKGFWFPWLTRTLQAIYECLPGTKISKYLGNVPGASELYLIIGLGIGAVWLSVVRRPLVPVLASPIVAAIGILFLFLRATELFFFSLHWVFAARGDLESVRRSRASFFMNLAEIAILLSIMSFLAGCAHSSPWLEFVDNLSAIFTLTPVDHPTGVSFCGFQAYYQLVLAGLVLTITVASLVGGVLRNEKNEDGNLGS